MSDFVDEMIDRKAFAIATGGGSTDDRLKWLKNLAIKHPEQASIIAEYIELLSERNCVDV